MIVFHHFPAHVHSLKNYLYLIKLDTALDAGCMLLLLGADPEMSCGGRELEIQRAVLVRGT